LAGQHPVQKNHIGQHRIQLALGAVTVLGPERLESVVAQVDGNQLGNGRLILDDQDSG